MSLRTRLTERFDLEHPVIQAPMAFVAGGRLASAVSAAGGLGLIGGGYGDGDWLDEQFRAARNAAIGCGFITWSLAERPQLLDKVLERRPSAIFLSFGDPNSFAPKIKDAGAPLICQIQRLEDAKAALEAGADVIVAQGAEAGGHGDSRATMTLVPEVADLLAGRSPETLLCAAGGVADGRGLAAALMLGADGVVVGTRFFAAREALVHPDIHAAALSADGDRTIRTTVIDVARDLDWPERFDIRILRNRFTEDWHGNEAALAEVAEREAERYLAASADGDADIAGTIVGEAVGLIKTVEPAGEILRRIVVEAETCLAEGAGLAVTL